MRLAGPEGSAWCEAARDSAQLSGIQTHRVDTIADPEGRFAEAYGISRSGAVSVNGVNLNIDGGWLLL